MEIDSNLDIQVAAKGDIDLTSILLDMVSQVADIWILISILVTLTLVQLLKAVLKHYQFKYWPDSDPMTRKIILFVAACLIGYIVSKEFLHSHIGNWKSFAYAISFLNPLIYKLILLFAEMKGWVRVVGMLKMRKVTEDSETGKLTLEKTIILHTDDLQKGSTDD